MADQSGKKIDNTDTFDSWKTKYNQIPDYMTQNDDDIDAINSKIDANAELSNIDAITYAIALG